RWRPRARRRRAAHAGTRGLRRTAVAACLPDRSRSPPASGGHAKELAVFHCQGHGICGIELRYRLDAPSIESFEDKLGRFGHARLAHDLVCRSSRFLPLFLNVTDENDVEPVRLVRLLLIHNSISWGPLPYKEISRIRE